MSDKKQLKIGVVGVSGRGGMAKHWHDPQGRSIVTAGMDVSDEALEFFKKNVNSEAFVAKDIDEFLSKADIDAVCVMSPDFTHQEYVIKAFKAGKHVFSEKPMALTTQGCDEMLKAWQASEKKFMIGFNMRYMNIFGKMKKITDSGAIGDIKTIWVRHFVGHGGEWYYHDWHGNSKNSTGLLLQKASHDIDMIHWITGQYTKKVTGFGSLDYYGGDKPDDLHCPDCDQKETCVEYNYTAKKGVNKLDQCVFRKEINVEDQSTIIMDLEGGIKATYMQCHYTPDYWRNYVFIGTKGRLENMDDSSKVIVKVREQYKKKEALKDKEYDIEIHEGGHGGADPVICKDFIDMLLDNKKPVATPLAGRMSVAVGCAATESIRNKNQVMEIPALPDELKDKIF